MILVNKFFKIPFSSVDLHRRSSEHLRNPPLPKDWRDAAVKIVGTSGVSLLDYWRTYHEQLLDEIALKRTWAAQRAKLISKVLAEEGWQAAEVAANPCEFVTSWEHLVAENDIFKRAPKEQWKFLLMQRYLLALLSSACLRELGCKLYALDKIKLAEMDLYYEFEREIKTLDVQFLDCIGKAIMSFDDERGKELAAIKDEQINPLIREQYQLLSLMEENVVNGKIDANDINSRMKSLEERKKEIGKLFMGDSRRAS